MIAGHITYAPNLVALTYLWTKQFELNVFCYGMLVVHLIKCFGTIFPSPHLLNNRNKAYSMAHIQNWLRTLRTLLL